VGRTLRLNSETRTVIGVAPATLQLPSADTNLWAPIGFARLSAPPQWTMRGFRAFSIIARLEPGVGLAQSRSDTSRIAAELSHEYPRFNADLGAAVTPLRDRIAGPVRPALLMLFAAVALVLLVACANLANLALARGVARSREMAIRTAIGASRRHVIAQVFAESALVAVGGTMLGLLLAHGILTLITIAPPPGLPRLGDVRLDAPVLLFTGALGVLSVFLFGTAPAVRLSRMQPGAVLQETRMAPPGTRRLHATLVALQIAASLVLLVGSAMLARSLAALLRVDTGIRAEGVLTARLDLTSGAFADPLRQTAFLDRLLSDLSAIPGVGVAGTVSSLPPSVSQMHTTMSARNPRTGQAEDVAIEMIAASPHVFGALGVPLIRGRLFSPIDTAGAPRVVVLGDRLARRLFPDEDPIGRSIAVGPSQPNAPLPVVVGVVGDVKYSGLEKAPDQAVYMPYGQRPFRATHVVVRTIGDRRGVTTALQKVIHAIDPGVAVGRILDLDAVVSAAAAQPALRTWLLTGLSGLALLLAAVGLYGVTAYGVTQRTAEIGLRSALGADRTSLLLMILRQGLGVTVAGLAVGAVAALTMASALSAFLFDVQPTDATSFAIGTACILLAGLMATLVPALRATRIEPLAALRG
jgi:putative ABC transport system permease protein